MRRHGYLYLLLAGVIFLWNCNASSSNDAGKSSQPKDNYIVLLDLSDRILFNNGQQVPKDIEVIKSIYNIFKSKLAAKDSTKQYYSVNDKLKLLGAPNWFYASIDLSAEQPDKRAAMPDKMEKTFNILLPEIYTGAITGNKGTAYSGADIWKYFNENLSDDVDKDAQNTLFIVTDGYMDVKGKAEHPAQKNRYASCTEIINALKDASDWNSKFTNEDYGLLPITKKFTNLRVIVLQVNPKAGWADEYGLLTKIWDKWFTEMGVTNYTLLKEDSSSQVTESLAKLMNTTVDSTAAAVQLTPLAVTDSLHAATAAIVAEKRIPDAGRSTDSATAKKEMPAVKKEKAGIVAPASAAPAPVQKNTASTPEVLPPDESDTRLLNTSKTEKLSVKKTVSKTNDDILQDDGAANGFNTGIKKNTKKKNR